MIDTAARMRYVYIRTYAGNAHPMNLSRARLLFEGGSYFSAQALRAATIRGRLLFDVRLMYGHRHIRSYTEQERLCSSFIRILRLFPDLNRNLLCEVEHICTA